MPTIHDYITSIIEQAGSLETAIGDDVDNPDVVKALKAIDESISMLLDALSLRHGRMLLEPEVNHERTNTNN